MNCCPCCSGPLVSQVDHNQTYWFCHSCWQAMPSCTDLNNPLSQVEPEHSELAPDLAAQFARLYPNSDTSLTPSA